MASRFPFDGFSPTHYIVWPGALPSCRYEVREVYWGTHCLSNAKWVLSPYIWILSSGTRDLKTVERHSVLNAAPWPRSSCPRTVTTIVPSSLWNIWILPKPGLPASCQFYEAPSHPPSNCLSLNSVLLALPIVSFYCVQLKNPHHFHSWILVQLTVVSPPFVSFCMWPGSVSIGTFEVLLLFIGFTLV